ncbi:unnamed protein product [Vicia faba]|uniref:Tyrosine-specific transport protein n=1 Tax=Vicia faba TaxID=3906 RepID=A0AAV0ZEP1_VICFA|nr:unnamed protein product [Vicia faba]
MQHHQLHHHLHKNLSYPKPPITLHRNIHIQPQKILTLSPSPSFTKIPSNLLHLRKITPCNAITPFPTPSSDTNTDTDTNTDINVNVVNVVGNKIQCPPEKKSFWGAVSLIIGAAVGPGMLGLPSLTIKSGPIPSTIIIFISWIYVMSSIILVAELCFDAMEKDNVEELHVLLESDRSFPRFSRIVMVLCFMMLVSITGLVGIGVVVARANIISSFGSISWKLSSILPIIPVAVLTVGFHVITPFICKISGDTIDDARKAILIGGTVPLVMVLSWNLIVLGLVGAKKGTDFVGDPITLLLSVNPSALSAVQGFAFSAMATSLIGYAVSLPKQILDTFEMVVGKSENGGVGLVSYSVFTASYFRSTFSRALDFAGVYANCFLFGIIPPVMTYFHQQTNKEKIRSSFIPGGNVTLLMLFIISVILAIWH